MDERFDSRNLDLDDPDDKKLWDELEENCDEDPQFGITLIRIGSFKEYAREFADEIGVFSIPVVSPRTGNNETRDLQSEWPFSHIDWDEAADELAEDWFEVEYKGETYLAR